VQRIAEGCLSVDSILIKILPNDDKSNANTSLTALVSWTIQEEEFGSHVLTLCNHMSTAISATN